MDEPNFSESQLQQAVNTSLIRRMYAGHGVHLYAYVPSLFAEFDLGWDTGFYMPWLTHPPSAKDEGCNFFVQYKLSYQLTSSGAKEWKHWKEQYLRFKIPHSKLNSSKKYSDDFHQWDALKALANKGYPTYYATNSTTDKTILRSWYDADTLLENVPALDVRSVSLKHRHVTFTDRSTHFLLHSELERSGLAKLSGVLEQLSGSERVSLRSASRRLVDDLIEVANDEPWRKELNMVRQRLYAQGAEPNPELDRMSQAAIASSVRRHLGAELFWLPKSG